MAQTATRDEQARNVPLSRLKADPSQPRKSFNDASLNELADSIKELGVLQPLLVIEAGGDYQIVAGERRYRAATLAGLTDVPVRLFPNRERAREAQLIENLQRENLPLLEEAQALAELKEQLNASLRTLEKALGKNKDYIKRRLDILGFPDDVKDMLRQEPGLLTQAQSIATIKDDSRRKARIRELMAGPSATIAPLPVKGGRPPSPFKFQQKKNGGFTLAVTYVPGRADKAELIKQLEEALQTLKTEKTV